MYGIVRTPASGSVELKRSVIGQRGVVYELGRDQVGVWREAIGIDASGNGGIETAPHVEKVASSHVLLQARSASLLAPESARPVGRDEVLVAEDRVGGEVVSRLHVVAPMRLKGY